MHSSKYPKGGLDLPGRIDEERAKELFLQLIDNSIEKLKKGRRRFQSLEMQNPDEMWSALLLHKQTPSILPEAPVLRPIFNYVGTSNELIKELEVKKKANPSPRTRRTRVRESPRCSNSSDVGHSAPVMQPSPPSPKSAKKQRCRVVRGTRGDVSTSARMPSKHQRCSSSSISRGPTSAGVSRHLSFFCRNEKKQRASEPVEEQYFDHSLLDTYCTFIGGNGEENTKREVPLPFLSTHETQRSFSGKNKLVSSNYSKGKEGQSEDTSKVFCASHSPDATSTDIGSPRETRETEDEDLLIDAFGFHFLQDIHHFVEQHKKMLFHFSCAAISSEEAEDDVVIDGSTDGRSVSQEEQRHVPRKPLVCKPCALTARVHHPLLAFPETSSASDVLAVYQHGVLEGVSLIEGQCRSAIVKKEECVFKQAHVRWLQDMEAIQRKLYMSKWKEDSKIIFYINRVLGENALAHVVQQEYKEIVLEESQEWYELLDNMYQDHRQMFRKVVENHHSALNSPPEHPFLPNCISEKNEERKEIVGDSGLIQTNFLCASLDATSVKLPSANDTTVKPSTDCEGAETAINIESLTSSQLFDKRKGTAIFTVKEVPLEMNFSPTSEHCCILSEFPVGGVAGSFCQTSFKRD